MRRFANTDACGKKSSCNRYGAQAHGCCSESTMGQGAPTGSAPAYR